MGFTMRARLRRLFELLGLLAETPNQVAGKIEEMKASPTGRKLTEIDARAGRFYARLNAAFWFALCAPLLGLAYLAGLVTDGWVETTILCILAVPVLYAAWSGFDRLRNPQSASEILVEELEDRVRPARWIMRILRFFGGRAGATAD